MQEVTSYKAVDGKLFETREACEAHEVQMFVERFGLKDFLNDQTLTGEPLTQARDVILAWEAHKRARTALWVAQRTLGTPQSGTDIEHTVADLHANPEFMEWLVKLDLAL
jgi:hypothetical protein